MKHILSDRSGEGHIKTAIVIIIAVVIGALLLAGLYQLFAGENGVIGQMDSEISAMMDYTQELRVERTRNEETGVYTLRYSYDGKHWNTPEMPTYSSTATVYGLADNNSETNPIIVAMIRDGNLSYILTSTDGGITWQEKVSFSASSITHFYFGTDAQLPSTSGSFSGEKFVVRYKNGNYYTMTSNGDTWTLPTWSDLIPLG